MLHPAISPIRPTSNLNRLQIAGKLHVKRGDVLDEQARAFNLEESRGRSGRNSRSSHPPWEAEAQDK